MTSSGGEGSLSAANSSKLEESIGDFITGMMGGARVRARNDSQSKSLNHLKLITAYTKITSQYCQSF